MRTLAIVLTVALAIPICGVLISAYSVSRLDSAYLDNKYVLLQLLSPIAIYIMAVILACVLNLQRKYLENAIMCGTVISIYIISMLLNFGIGLAAQWLR